MGKSGEDVYPARTALPEASIATALPISMPWPPRYVLYTSALPEELSLSAKAFCNRSSVDCSGLTVGKLMEVVVPVIYAHPDPSTAMAAAVSEPFPPIYVLYTRAPPGAIFAANASWPPPDFDWNADVNGKSAEDVLPVIYALAEASTAMPVALSRPPPPRNVLYSNEPLLLNFATNASWTPAKKLCTALATGKLAEAVSPAT